MACVEGDCATMSYSFIRRLDQASIHSSLSTGTSVFLQLQHGYPLVVVFVVLVYTEVIQREGIMVGIDMGIGRDQSLVEVVHGLECSTSRLYVSLGQSVKLQYLTSMFISWVVVDRILES